MVGRIKGEKQVTYELPYRERLKARAIELYKDGFSFGQIIREDGFANVTKNMVTGWITRAGITLADRKTIPKYTKNPNATMSGFREVKFDMKQNQLFPRGEKKKPEKLSRKHLLKGEPEPIGPENNFPDIGCCVYTKDEVAPNKSWRFCGHSGYPYCEFHAILIGTVKS